MTSSNKSFIKLSEENLFKLAFVSLCLNPSEEFSTKFANITNKKQKPAAAKAPAAFVSSFDTVRQTIADLTASNAAAKEKAQADSAAAAEKRLEDLRQQQTTPVAAAKGTWQQNWQNYNKPFGIPNLSGQPMKA